MKKKLMIILVLFSMVLNIRSNYLQNSRYIVEDESDIEWNSYDDDSYIV